MNIRDIAIHICAGFVGAMAASGLVILAVTENERWLSFSGSIIGGLVGGVVTVFAAFVALRSQREATDAAARIAKETSDRDDARSSRHEREAEEMANAALTRELEDVATAWRHIENHFSRRKPMPGEISDAMWAWGSIALLARAPREFDFNLYAEQLSPSRRESLRRLNVVLGHVRKLADDLVVEQSKEPHANQRTTDDYLNDMKYEIFDLADAVDEYSAKVATVFDGRTRISRSERTKFRIIRALTPADFAHHSPSPAASTSSSAPTGPSA